MQDISTKLVQVVQDTFGTDIALELTRPEERFGDFATNVALQLAGRLGRNPREVAETLSAKLKEALGGMVASVDIAGPGFINITLSDQALSELSAKAAVSKPATFKGQVIVTEYSDPNPFKALHAGHLYTSVVGHAISNLFEVAGGTVHRVNFGGDVGMHVAKAMWGIVRELGGEHPEKLAEVPEDGHAEWMAKCYVAGSNAYEDDEQAKAEITVLNKRIYGLHESGDLESPFAKLYWTCRRWSYDYFDAFYARIGVTFEKYYPESEVAPLGLSTVREQLAKGVYKESDGAVVFVGEPYGLHTRVFINSQGLPTYEAKDVGLIMKKWQDYHFDHSVVITGNDINEYMKVVLKSVEQFAPELPQRTTHFTHGNVKLQGGVKMSSRKGNVLRAVDVLDAAKEANKKLTGKDDEGTVLGAVKYAFLKQRMGADLIYDPAESVSLDGNSGPYLQYAHARARSIIGKSSVGPVSATQDVPAGERSLMRKIGEYPEAVQRSVEEFMPHHVCSYLYELAQTFNRFYEHNRVIGDEREAARLSLVTQYADVLKDGLQLLGISAPDRM